MMRRRDVARSSSIDIASKPVGAAVVDQIPHERCVSLSCGDVKGVRRFVVSERLVHFRSADDRFSNESFLPTNNSGKEKMLHRLRMRFETYAISKAARFSIPCRRERTGKTATRHRDARTIVVALALLFSFHDRSDHSG